MIAFFLAGAVLMGLAGNAGFREYAKPLVAALATLTAAFLGANYAFRLQREHAEREEEKRQVEAGNKAIFELVRTLNQFLTIRKQFIDPHRSSPARNMYIMPMTGSVRPLEIAFDELAFLFPAANPNLLSRIAMFQQEVASTLDVINQRSRIHVDIVQPKVEELERIRGAVLKVEDLEAALGTRVAQQVTQLTDYMIEGVDDVVAGAEQLVGELNGTLKGMYPQHTVIGVATSNKRMQPTPQSGAADT